MKPFEERDRYDYSDLTPDSVVVDAGCFEGNFSAILHDKYGCRVIALEPVPEFFQRCAERLHVFPKIRVLPFALGDHTSVTHLQVKGDQSGQWCASESKAEALTITPAFLLEQAREFGAEEVALLKLNIEGGEFPVLEYMLNRGLVRPFRHIQVQFHKVVPNFAERHDAIRAGLSRTHDLVYDEPFIWTGWSLRP